MRTPETAAAVTGGRDGAVTEGPVGAIGDAGASAAASTRQAARRGMPASDGMTREIEIPLIRVFLV